MTLLDVHDSIAIMQCTNVMWLHTTKFLQDWHVNRIYMNRIYM